MVMYDPSTYRGGSVQTTVVPINQQQDRQVTHIRSGVNFARTTEIPTTSVDVTRVETESTKSECCKTLLLYNIDNVGYRICINNGGDVAH